MNRKFLYLTKSSKLADLTVVIHHVGAKPYTIPVIQSEEQR